MNEILLLVKKYAIIGLLVVAVIALAASHFQIEISPKGLQNKLLSFEENSVDVTGAQTNTNVKKDILTPDSINTGNFDAIPHLYCAAQSTLTTLPTSNTYNSSFPYPTYFMGSGEHFQDLNGDNLVDYIWNSVSLAGSNPEMQSVYQSCVYLNNGNGWTRASICNARTKVNSITGQVIEAEYRGDCAGTPSASGGDKE